MCLLDAFWQVFVIESSAINLERFLGLFPVSDPSSITSQTSFTSSWISCKRNHVVSPCVSGFFCSTLLKFVPIVRITTGSSFLTNKQHSVLRRYHHLSTSSLSSFWCFVIMNKVAMNILIQIVLLGFMFTFLCSQHRGVELLDHKVCVCLTL